jgi:serine/threonine protein phosphatase 1
MRSSARLSHPNFPLLAIAKMKTPMSRLYVIGDIHGRFDLLERMIELINADIKVRGNQCLIVTLGDYIDRGPDSRAVVDRLLNNPFSGNFIPLKGNHEALLDSFLENPAEGATWWRLGGWETLKSYGIAAKPRMTRRGFTKVATQLREALSRQQLEFFKSLKTSLIVGNYFLCHAGVRPGIALEHQREEDLLWIRDEFLDAQIDFGKIVVHGHTPVRDPDVQANRINIDTGAFLTGRLTCIVLEEGRHRFLVT